MLQATIIERSNILDVVRSVKWSLGFNLRTLVSCIHLLTSMKCDYYGSVNFLKDHCLHTLATSIRGAYHSGFCNGQSKAIVHDLVLLVRQEACAMSITFALMCKSGHVCRRN